MKQTCFRILPCVAFAGVMALTASGGLALAAVGQSTPSTSLYAQLESFHGHVCAGSLFGARLGLAARETLTAAGGTGKFKAHYYDLSCPVDGIQLGAGTTYGNKAISVTDRDEHRLVLTAEGNGMWVEAKLTPRAEEMGLKSRELGKRAKALPAGTPAREQLEREIDTVYTWLKTAPAVEIVILSAVHTKKGTRS